MHKGVSSGLRKERAFRLALEGGIRTMTARLEWTEWALDQVQSEDWRSAPETTEATPSPV